MKEKGQAMVEFAVILPFMIALSVAIIYLGALFLDYTQYSNAARDIARDISLQQDRKRQRLHFTIRRAADKSL